MRLDEYLVTEGIISSRSRAKRFIQRGLVSVNGKTVTKPSQKVEHGCAIEVAEEDRPQGYFKLKGIQEKTGVIHEGDTVLDIGSSAGGFLMYASGIASHVTGIEFSEEFREPLERVVEEYPGVNVIFDDAFNMDLSRLNREFDVILNDMTVDPEVSISITMRFKPLLKSRGRVMQVLKLGDRQDPEPMIKELEEKGFKVTDVIRPEKREAYIAASRID
ncbi:cell division protein FtsJ [Methanocella sp. CWC-04]|uniref:Cell division protein FtsJ n=1 Tax=Methanooceanicella nereidis TaxID=2052831 RepID=A0AAP2W5E0_9EURY|nr:S4 domain-containing protein [Methanocella sp. CWC-04]MCD1294087.1 cell division protein FtsJ [Methanocella sp. CWC-04]